MNTKLKILTLCTFSKGGAGTGTMRRIFALRKSDVDVRLFSLEDRNCSWNDVSKKAIKPVEVLPGFQAREIFSLTDNLIDFQTLESTFKAYDVIHLHWVVGMLDYENIGHILSNKPIVWTLADMNAFTGGCHYSEGCKEFVRQCRSCPLLGGQSDLAHQTWKIKRKAYNQLNNLAIICPSKWMATMVKESSLLGDRPVYYIPNPLPFHEFLPHNKLVSRIKLNIPINKTYILFGTDSNKNTRKGGDLLVQTLNIFCKNYNVSNVEVLMFGSHQLELPVPIHYMGKIHNNTKLSMIYSAADIFVFPSREDNAPLTVGESLACGTPVVSFPVGNTVEIIKHKVNGYLANYLDVVDMADGINWLIEHLSKQDIYKYQLHCRDSILEHHDPALSIEKHISAYNDSLSKNIRIEQQLPVCGCFLTYPDRTGKRTVEGGLRIKGHYKYSKGKDNPLVSIITVCLNSSSTILQTIQSVLRQSYKNIEYIIVDGGSTDGTIDIIEKYETAIDYFISEPDSGLYNAMNKGLSLASGDYILLLNSDDWYEFDCVKILVDAKLKTQADFVGALTYFVKQDGSILRPLPSAPYNDSVRFRNPLRHELLLISRDIYNRIGNYNEKYDIIADLEFIIRLYESKLEYYEVQNYLLYFRVTGLSSVNNIQNLIDERKKLIKSQFNFLDREVIELLSSEQKPEKPLLEKILIKYSGFGIFTKTLIAFAKQRCISLNLEHYEAKEKDKITIVPTQADELQTSVFYIVTPTFNSEEFIDSTIMSVLSQEGDFEIYYHIQDGGSSDATLEKIKWWQSAASSSDSNIIRCKGISISYNSSSDLGMYDAINKGFDKLSPPIDGICSWINSDDVYTGGAFASVKKIFSDNPTEEWIINPVSGCGKFQETLSYLTLQYPTEIIKYGLCDGVLWRFIQQEGCFWKHNLWKDVGGLDSSLKLCGDWDIWRRFAQRTDPIHVLWSLGKFRLHDKQLSYNLMDDYYNEMNLIISEDERNIYAASLENAKFNLIKEVSFKNFYKNNKNLKYQEVTLNSKCVVPTRYNKQFISKLLSNTHS
ncbi:MAG: glycosyltransferase [Thiotrichaceae bacterium]|nr:glycosyltransferase [Thiotrichaceae bacterium]